jgi:hypothetical protein
LREDILVLRKAALPAAYLLRYRNRHKLQLTLCKHPTANEMATRNERALVGINPAARWLSQW